ncbi:hypothetical protein ACKVMT_17245 [Halobacteriales archaeon Cl-PHB]
MSPSTTEPEKEQCAFVDPDFGTCPYAEHPLLTAVFGASDGEGCPHVAAETGCGLVD